MKNLLILVTLAAGTLGLSNCRDDPSMPMSPEVELAMAARTSSYEVQAFQVDLPGALQPRAFGINAQGDVVGWYRAGSPEVGLSYRGFLWSGGEFHPIRYPGAENTLARGVNERGDIVGSWSGPGAPRGFLLRDGEYTPVDYPGASATYATDINSDGAIAGTWMDESGAGHGFFLQNGVITSFDVDVEGATSTWADGINPQGEIAGYYYHPERKYGPFIRLADGTFLTDYDPPEPGAPFLFLDINAGGDIVGAYEWWDPDWGGGHRRYTAFVLDRHGTYRKLETAEARSTEAVSINPSGMVVGYGWPPISVAFVAVPVNPAGK